MKNLVGRSFALAEGRYRIVDVQRLGGDALIYAEREEKAGGRGSAGAGRPPGRTAFHYGDIARFLEAGTSP
jgi:hypothetical protein